MENRWAGLIRKIYEVREVLISCLLLAAAISLNAQEKEFPKLTGPYLGQKPPGMTPEIFAPGIVSVESFIEFKGAFSTDGKEYYFYRHALPEIIPTLFFTKVEDGVWIKPVPLPIAQGTRTAHPCISPDNKWLFFTWTFGRDQNQRSGYYVSERTEAGWSAPKYAGPGMYLTCDNSGQLYTTESVWGNQPKHYLAKVTFSNGLFTHYERLNINPHHENQTHPCIAPDGSYIVFDINVENGSLFVSFKDKAGNWGEAIDLTEHGFKPNTRGAYISPDGKYLFYAYKGNIWWVDIRVIENLRPKEQAGPDKQKITGELFSAAEKGDLQTVKNLLTKYPEMKNVKQSGGWTLLHRSFNSRALVEYLIALGADIEARSDGRWTPLHSHAYKGNKDAVELLLEHGADIEAKHAYEITPLIQSIRWNRVETAKLLVEKGADVNAADVLGRTSLILSATKGYLELAKIFLESDAGIGIKDKNHGRTALHFAALNGHLNIVAELLKKGAEVNEKDAAGKTPLDYANRYGHEKVAKLLKSSGAEGKIDPRNFGFSPYLKKALKEGEAYAWYMGRAGYAVKTKNRLLLFSYYVEGHLPEEPRLANGQIDLDEIADCDVIIFAGSPAYWHHNPERYKSWQKTHKNITFIYSFEDKLGGNWRTPPYLKDVEGPNYIHLPDGGKKTLNGLNVETIPVSGLGSPGSGFLVEADGVAIFFGGDHVLLGDSQREAFRKPIDYLKDTGKAIDLLILPANLSWDRIIPSSREGVEYAVKTLRPKVYLASDDESTEFILSEAIAGLEKQKSTKIFCPEHRGDMFILKD